MSERRPQSAATLESRHAWTIPQAPKSIGSCCGLSRLKSALRGGIGVRSATAATALNVRFPTFPKTLRSPHPHDLLEPLEGIRGRYETFAYPGRSHNHHTLHLCPNLDPMQHRARQTVVRRCLLLQR